MAIDMMHYVNVILVAHDECATNIRIYASIDALMHRKVSLIS